MRSGVVAVPSGDFEEIGEYDTVREERGFELAEVVDVDPPQQRLGTDLPPVQTGQALLEEAERVSVPYAEDGQIRTEEQYQKVPKLTDFLTSPGEFVVVENNDGKFFYEDILPDLTDVRFGRANINLDSYAQTRPDANPWKVGFDNAGGNAEKGTVYGDDVVNDPDMGVVLNRSNKNQLGLEFEYEGRDVKVDIAANGWVNMIEPSAGSAFFSNFIYSELMPHC